ncbi:MAG TPA: DHA2 family efflux MFS transporter permease subunit [Candidatus Obscuribacterales bacterium]
MTSGVMSGAEGARGAQAASLHGAQTMSQHDTEAPVPFKNWVAVIGSAIGAFMAVLDIQITASSLRDIQGGLGASVDEGSWISTAYLIAEIVTIPLTGWLSQVFSRRVYITFNAALFIIFSMLCGLAHDLPTMIVWRAAQGFTGGVLIPMSFSTILTMLPKSKQPIGLAIFGMTATFAPSIGPAVGGFITDTLSWQYIFFLNLIPGIALISMLLYALPAEKFKLDLLKRSDIPGIISMSVGLSCLIYVLEEGQRKDWFGSELIQRAAVVAGISLTFFIMRELMAKYPLVNLGLLLRRNFGVSSIANVGLGIALYGSVYLLPVYLAVTQGYSAWQIGQVLIWSGMPQLLIIPFLPVIMKRVDTRLIIGFGLIMFGISCLMNVWMSHDYAGEQLIASMIIRSLGQPFIITPLSAMAAGGIEAEQLGSASALFNMMRNLGGSVGTAFASTLVTQREQFHSERIGEHLSNSDPLVRQWLTNASHTLYHAGATAWTANQQAIELLASKVRTEAFVMAFNDSFGFLAVILLLAAFTVIFLQKPQGAPAAHME